MIDRTRPLIDLHRHLDGSVRIETILDLARTHGIALPARDVAGLSPHVRVTGTEPDVMSFIARFRWMREVMADAEACARMARESVEDAHREGLDYVELRFSPWFMAERHGLDPVAVVEAVLDGIEAGSAATGLRASTIGTLSRTYGPEVAARELDALLRCRERLVAIDLAGDERRWPARHFAAHFRRVRDLGLGVTVHAGEADGPESVWQAIRDLGATRIGHGVRAADDERLLDHMLAHRVGIEANLTSNVQTSTVPDYASHPMRGLLARGLLVTINTDDPGISGIDLAHEYDVASRAAGLTPDQVRQAQANALEIAFLSAAEKQALALKAAARVGVGGAPAAPATAPPEPA